MTGFDTKAIHGGIKGKNPSNALNPPIFQTSTFVFDNIEHANKIMSFESDDYVYTRGNNPTLRLFENRMAELEYGSGAVAFSSGMAAISSTIFSLLKPEDNIIVHKTLYGSSYSVITELLPKYNMNYKIIDLTNLDELKNAIDSSTKVIYFETPSNPDLSIIDITKVSEIAKKNNIKVVVDNTFASPYFQNPLLLGADVVVHSATKYICGHGDVVGGVAIGKDIDYIQYLKFGYMCEFGGVMSPFNAWLLLRGLKTLGIRMRQHEKNAIEVVNFLKNHPKIDSVLYPGLEDFKGHSIAEEQMKGFGAMISFEVKGGLESAIKFVDSLKLAQLAVSLGDCETLVQLPAAITHRGYPRERLAEFGLTESMVRISVGLEDSKDIIEDLEQALKLI
ncbi:trans-sulfuration enzyme family protein [Tissierella praeacuta]|uniref:trans-sulfuration enzyme family protein n=1 Tax=Tissierella praeacuta TaxID=43131 RepID=UPI0028A0AE74|nr:PLP-dependent aspartate aminotransferase family protein [Tissierella praeacuta]